MKLATSFSPLMMTGSAKSAALAGIAMCATRSRLADSLTATCGPPYGQPLDSVMSTRRPSARAVLLAKLTWPRKAGDR